MPRRRSVPKQFSMYRVTASDVKGVEVGKVLIDKGTRLTAVWHVLDLETGEETQAVGKRVGQLCAECRVTHRKAAPLGHAGDHGPAAPIAKPNDEEVADA